MLHGEGQCVQVERECVGGMDCLGFHHRHKEDHQQICKIKNISHDQID